MSSAKKWHLQEKQLLREKFPTTPWPDLIAMFGRTKAAIASEAAVLGLKRQKPRPPPWSAQEIQVMHDLYMAHGAAEVSRITGRPVQAVLKKAQHLGIKVRLLGVRPWSAEEDAALRAGFRAQETEQIGAMLGRSSRAVYQRARVIGLVTPTGRNRLLPLGAERMRGKHLVRRVAETGDRYKDWKRVDILEWEAVNGSVPEGYVLLTPKNRSRAVEPMRFARRSEVPLHAVRQNATAEHKLLLNLKSQFGQQLRMIEKRALAPGQKPMQPGCRWTDEDWAFVVEKYEHMPVAEIAAHLGRTESAVKAQIELRHLRRATQVDRKAWTINEEQQLRSMRRSHTVSQIADALGRSSAAVQRKADKLKLRKKDMTCQAPANHQP